MFNNFDKMVDTLMIINVTIMLTSIIIGLFGEMALKIPELTLVSMFIGLCLMIAATIIGYLVFCIYDMYMDWKSKKDRG